jgi:HEAT repeat protein
VRGIVLSCWACGAVILMGSEFAFSQPKPDVENMLADLKSSSVPVRCRAVERLADTRDKQLNERLIDLLKDENARVRFAAARALAERRDSHALPALVASLEDDDLNVRFYAAHALGEIKQRAAAEALIRALDDPEWCVRDQAAWALREINDPETLEQIIRKLARPDQSYSHVVWLVRTLQSDNKVEQVASLLKSADAAARLRALQMLEELDEPQAVVPLQAALADEEPEIRLRAVKALVNKQTRDALPSLRRLLKNEEVPAVSEAARQAVSELSRHPSLAAHWSFEDADNKTVRNLLADGNDGRLHGCQGVPGIAGQALSFQGRDYVEFGQPRGLPMANSPFTVTAWVRSEADNGVVIARGGAFCGFSLYVKDGRPHFGIHRDQAGPGFITRGKQSIVGRWVFLAGVVDSSHIRVFADGQPVGEEATAGLIPGNCGQGMEIGFDVANSPAEITDHFRGQIDEVKIYSAALSAAELAELHRSESPR